MKQGQKRGKAGFTTFAGKRQFGGETSERGSMLCHTSVVATVKEINGLGGKSNKMSDRKQETGEKKSESRKEEGEPR